MFGYFTEERKKKIAKGAQNVIEGARKAGSDVQKFAKKHHKTAVNLEQVSGDMMGFDELGAEPKRTKSRRKKRYIEDDFLGI